MNDVKIDVKNRTISFGDFIKFYDVPEYVINYINQLQSNWNSLREFVNDWIEDLENQRESVEGTDLFENHTLVILDDIKTRMNELEGVSDEN